MDVRRLVVRWWANVGLVKVEVLECPASPPSASPWFYWKWLQKSGSLIGTHTHARTHETVHTHTRPCQTLDTTSTIQLTRTSALGLFMLGKRTNK